MAVPIDDLPAAFDWDDDTKSFVRADDGEYTLYYNEDVDDFVMSKQHSEA